MESIDNVRSNVNTSEITEEDLVELLPSIEEDIVFQKEVDEITTEVNIYVILQIVYCNMKKISVIKYLNMPLLWLKYIITYIF